MVQPSRIPTGVSVDAVDWLPSGARSGLVRVRGHRPEGEAVELPVLVLDRGGTLQHFNSLPDPRGARDPGAWRGAYVVDATLAATADTWALEWPGGARTVLQRPEDLRASVAAETGDAGGEVVDRGVLAERRARRAEAAEQAQARIAREALRAVEVLELRANEVEQRLAAAEAERDALRGRPAEAAEPVEAVDPAVEAALREEIGALRAEVLRLSAQPAPAPVPTPSADPTRLREALASTVGVVAQLRLQLFEAQVARRTREVGWSADVVRLTVIEREHRTVRSALAGAQAELATARAELEAARAGEAAAAAALQDAQALAAGAEAAHDETRRRFTERVAEVGAARERIAALEAEVAAVRAEASRAAAEAADAVRAEAAEQADARIADAEADAAARIASAEAAAIEALQRAEQAEEAAADALMAREIAEAAVVAARAERQASEVAHAMAEEALQRRPPVEEVPAPLSIPKRRPDTSGAPAFDLSGALGAAAGRLKDATPKEPTGPVAVPDPAPVPVPEEVAEALAAQAEAAEEARREPPEDPERPLKVCADLDTAAQELRRRPTIVSPAGEPPGDLVRGGRDYPPLRGALVKLAHDDPDAAAGLLTGLLPALHAAVAEPVSCDVTIAEMGTFAVDAGEDATGVELSVGPRGRSKAAFHLRAGAITLAELLAGVGGRPGRLGAARTSGRVRRARAVAAEVAASGVTLPVAMAAGARVDPILGLRCLAYAVHPSWTRGLDACIEVVGPRGQRVYACLDDGGLHVRPEAPDHRVDSSVVLGHDAVAAVLSGDPLVVRGERPPVDALQALAMRAAGA